jgi:4'-phosphopantetheinyl transferase EntD
VDSLIRALFTNAVVVHTAMAAPSDDGLWPEERAYIAGAVMARRAEFGTARQCARRALAEIGLAAAPLVPIANDGPLWPSGVVGSISHSQGYCAAVVGHSPPLASLGLDVETLRLLDPGVAELITTPGERRWLATMPAAMRNYLAIVCFSAKEAYYKCQHRLTRTVLDFADVELSLTAATADWSRGAFIARALKPGLDARIISLQGRFAADAERVATGVELTSGASR